MIAPAHVTCCHDNRVDLQSALCRGTAVTPPVGASGRFRSLRPATSRVDSARERVDESRRAAVSAREERHVSSSLLPSLKGRSVSNSARDIRLESGRFETKQAPSNTAAVERFRRFILYLFI